MDIETIGIVISVAGIIISVIAVTNKFIIKNSGNIKNAKQSDVTMSNVIIGKDNKITKGDENADK